MPTAPNQNIPQNVVRHIRVATRDNLTGQISQDPLVPLASPVPAIAVATMNATDSRVIDITPGNSTGSINLVISKSPAGAEPLIIPVTITQPVNLGTVEFDGVAMPDTPKA